MRGPLRATHGVCGVCQTATPHLPNRASLALGTNASRLRSYKSGCVQKWTTPAAQRFNTYKANHSRRCAPDLRKLDASVDCTTAHPALRMAYSRWLQNSWYAPSMSTLSTLASITSTNSTPCHVTDCTLLRRS